MGRPISLKTRILILLIDAALDPADPYCGVLRAGDMAKNLRVSKDAVEVVLTELLANGSVSKARKAPVSLRECDAMLPVRIGYCISQEVRENSCHVPLATRKLYTQKREEQEAAFEAAWGFSISFT